MAEDGTNWTSENYIYEFSVTDVSLYVGPVVINVDTFIVPMEGIDVNDVYFCIYILDSWGVPGVSITVYDSTGAVVVDNYTGECWDTYCWIYLEDLASGEYSWNAYYNGEIVDYGTFYIGEAVTSVGIIVCVDEDDAYNDFVFGAFDISWNGITTVWVDVYDSDGVLVASGYTDQTWEDATGLFFVMNLTKGYYTFTASYNGVVLQSGRFYSYGSAPISSKTDEKHPVTVTFPLSALSPFITTDRHVNAISLLPSRY